MIRGMIICNFEDGTKVQLRHTVVENILVKDGKVLLAKRADRLIEGGKWCIVGGYMDRDETVQQAVERETLEEAGYKVKDITFFWVNDNPRRKGEDRQNIVLVHFSETAGKVEDPDDESSETRWFDLEKLPADEEMAFDHTETLRLYKKYLAEPFPIPGLGNVV